MVYSKTGLPQKAAPSNIAPCFGPTTAVTKTPPGFPSRPRVTHNRDGVGAELDRALQAGVIHPRMVTVDPTASSSTVAPVTGLSDDADFVRRTIAAAEIDTDSDQDSGLLGPMMHDYAGAARDGLLANGGSPTEARNRVVVSEYESNLMTDAELPETDYEEVWDRMEQYERERDAQASAQPSAPMQPPPLVGPTRPAAVGVDLGGTSPWGTSPWSASAAG